MAEMLGLWPPTWDTQAGFPRSPGSNLAKPRTIVGIWGVKQQMGGLGPSAFQIK